MSYTEYQNIFTGGQNQGSQIGHNSGNVENHYHHSTEDPDRKDLIHCLSSSYRSQKDSNRERVEGTCEWFVQDSKFKEWHSSQQSCLLHVFAGPGCGKSVLARHLVDSGALKSSASTIVLYFFFKAAQEGQTRGANAITAMLHQLYTQEQGEGMVIHALPKYKAHGAKLPIMFEELWDILRNTIEDPTAGEVVCVFDALDECLQDDRSILLSAMIKYFEVDASNQSSGGRLKAIITSRPYQDIGLEYNRMTGGLPVVRLDGSDKIDLISQEINVVIEYEVPQVLPTVSKELQRKIIKQLQNMENRTYLWLHLILDHIKKNGVGKYTEKKMNKLIATLPTTVNDAYREMLQQSKDFKQARILLHLVVAAKRPLTVSELKIAVALIEDDEEYELYKDLYNETEKEEQFTNSLQNICGLMLNVYDSRVYLIHQTAREYLCSERFIFGYEQNQWQGPIVKREADALAAKSCISMLKLKDFSMPRPWKGLQMESWEIEKHIDDWVQKYDFLDYAGTYWAIHGRYTAGISGEVNLEEQTRLCVPSSNVFWVWYPIFCKSQYHDTDLPFNGLVFASFIGHQTLAKRFLHNETNINAKDKRYGNALYAASSNGNEKIVQLLLNHGANINAQGGEYGSALQAASSKGHENVVYLLLNREANINAKDGRYGNALYAASSNGNEKIVQLLLDHGADINAQGGHINAQGGHNSNALQAASLEGKEKIVQLLLDHGADINTQGGYYGNALQAASWRGHEKTVQLLLDRGVDINTQGGNYGNALQAASWNGNEKIVQLLLDRGADVNAQGGKYGNALQAASRRGHDKIVQLLLDRGADNSA